MKLVGLTTICASAIVLLFSCGKVKDAANAAEGLKNYAQNMEASTKKMEDRRSKGDTIALPYAELQKYLPASVSGYTKDGDPEGESMNMTGASYSTASQKFKKGDDDLKVTIVDYNAAYALFGMATAMMQTGFSVDNADEKLGGVELKAGKGWEDFKKKEKRASVVVTINERFLVTVEASNQTSTDLVKDVANSLDLKKLADL
ncbi:hypothetical protein SAMN04515674_102250 [Pseudarcicella hirudinis]|uniref:Lipoprotein n=1 Tax=Pseudarcicella hirudinis TaxID=1079859 RepID=A0A1I5P381_9BACT|nr:hypothetical protein [Pseudarcicella hirudinis]SFP28427.1 hypothetical protein SAMN04515674_102250 [Pseudarcicella hirudinis]